jgi:uncharacterized protein (TIGR03086 family)
MSIKPSQHAFDGLVALDRRAVERSIGIAATVTKAQLALPTPCAGWSLGDLLAHMIAQHQGFAAAAAGDVADVSVWRWRPLGEDPAADYARAAGHVIAAFGSDGVRDHSLWLPEILDGGPFPAAMAIGFHLLDYVVHGWDVAASLGIEADYPADVVAAALAISEQVPTGAARTALGAAFAPPVASALTDSIGSTGSALDQLLRVLGRSPRWPQW